MPESKTAQHAYSTISQYAASDDRGELMHQFFEIFKGEYTRLPVTLVRAGNASGTDAGGKGDYVAVNVQADDLSPETFGRFFSVTQAENSSDRDLSLGRQSITAHVVICERASQVPLGVVLRLMVKGARQLWTEEKPGGWSRHSIYTLTARRVPRAFLARLAAVARRILLPAIHKLRIRILRHPRVARSYLRFIRFDSTLPVARGMKRMQLGWLHGAIDPVPVPARSHPGEKFSVILVSGTLGPGGAERQVVNTAIGLAKTGRVQVRVLCQSLGSEASRFFLDELVGRGIQVDQLEHEENVTAALDSLNRFHRRLLSGLTLSSIQQISAYTQYFQSVNPDVVHTWLDEINVKAGLGAILAGIPKVVLSSRSVAPHNFLIYRIYMGPGYRALLARSNVSLACNSEAGRRSYADWLSIPEDRITVVRNGFDPGYFEAPARQDVEAWMQAQRLDSDRPIVGTVTRFNEEKQPFLWIRFAALLAKRHPEVQFVMIGGGPLLAKSKNLAVRLGAGSRIVFTGLVRNTKCGIAAMDVFVLTSRLEGLPNAIIEAQSFGVPVVTTDAGGAPEAIVPNETGIVVGVDDADGIVRATADILDGHRWRIEAGQKSREFATNTFAVDRMITETLALYRVSEPSVQPVSAA